MNGTGSFKKVFGGERGFERLDALLAEKPSKTGRAVIAERDNDYSYAGMARDLRFLIERQARPTSMITMLYDRLPVRSYRRAPPASCQATWRSV